MRRTLGIVNCDGEVPERIGILLVFSQSKGYFIGISSLLILLECSPDISHSKVGCYIFFVESYCLLIGNQSFFIFFKDKKGIRLFQIALQEAGIDLDCLVISLKGFLVSL